MPIDYIDLFCVVSFTMDYFFFPHVSSLEYIIVSVWSNN